MHAPTGYGAQWALQLKAKHVIRTGGNMKSSFGNPILGFASLGFVAGAGIAFVYANMDPLELMYAEAKGFPRWTLHGLPFTAPWAMLGALLGAAAGSLVKFRRAIAVLVTKAFQGRQS